MAKLNVNRGKLLVGKVNSSAKPVLYEYVTISVRNFSLTSQFPFELMATLPGSREMKISGRAGPINAEDPSKPHWKPL